MRTIYRKVKAICTGWWRFLFRKKSIMAYHRLQICLPCELRKGRFCSVCWCELDAKAELKKEEGGVCEHPKGDQWDI